mmetsp:Transcript_9899/g.26320  ORF Transcript_9899/g.26320 Transcript_9899/m.26320 type:complete len:212 (+) Transcript_9899:752-1387(+)
MPMLSVLDELVYCTNGRSAFRIEGFCKKVSAVLRRGLFVLRPTHLFKLLSEHQHPPGSLSKCSQAFGINDRRFPLHFAIALHSCRRSSKQLFLSAHNLMHAWKRVDSELQHCLAQKRLARCRKRDAAIDQNGAEWVMSNRDNLGAGIEVLDTFCLKRRQHAFRFAFAQRDEPAVWATQRYQCATRYAVSKSMHEVIQRVAAVHVYARPRSR